MFPGFLDSVVCPTGRKIANHLIGKFSWFAVKTVQDVSGFKYLLDMDDLSSLSSFG